MKRFFSSIVLIIIAVIVGFWLSSANVLEGTKIGEILSAIVTRIPAPALNEAQIETNNLLTDSSSTSSSAAQSIDDTTASIDYQLIESQILESLNHLRREKNLPELKINEQLQKASRKRAQETKELFSHTRPDGSDTFTVLTEPEYHYTYQLAGENIGMATYYLDEKGMAELLFNGWKESPGHYENMVRKEFTEVGIGVYYDGETLYAVQLFGTPMPKR